ncbi:hypothetical protein ACO22_06337 [Paracoccidioides brasiliensis]|uniref:Uncharacterized protein n=1 Tax=Paracoccidioides brasiliensis TaxID=121759 RepID=A0A1D2J7R5_PARBR|nr:hypothetical protein ACO22_06337 [Paracoccidioides brasiliensis]
MFRMPSRRTARTHSNLRARKVPAWSSLPTPGARSSLAYGVHYDRLVVLPPAARSSPISPLPSSPPSLPIPLLRFTTLSASDHSLAGMGPCPKVPALPWVVAWRGSYQKLLAQHLGAGVGRKWLLQKTQTAKTALTAKLKLITWF